jgi:hypothetical protein
MQAGWACENHVGRSQVTLLALRCGLVDVDSG